jgi:hypothetical protein
LVAGLLGGSALSPDQCLKVMPENEAIAWAFVSLSTYGIIIPVREGPARTNLTMWMLPRRNPGRITDGQFKPLAERFSRGYRFRQAIHSNSLN